MDNKQNSNLKNYSLEDRKRDIVDEIRDFTIEFLEDRKAYDIELYDMQGKSSLCDYNIVASAASANQNYRMAADLEGLISEKFGKEALSVEGTESKRWILLDYGDVIIHLMHKEEREYYNPDRLFATVD